MKIFFGTLKIMISQLSCDIGMWFYGLFWVLWDQRYAILKRMVAVIGIIVTLLFDVWIFIILFNWAEHPLVIVGVILIVLMQVGAWINRKDFYKWFLNRWSRASQTYRHRR